ncbi:cadmium resistance transporter [Conexibacter stalactiti]|uniref:Cadmium resistance transporter n=1 Tax=Conexibacter stalactiti TaxID=1940611 RepID=A0ABU4HU20_9ACTN|nr:cadmium resistance transporter [Conexibacter stalactiti]MDW5596811.1 cadmium resistance transporter [Conexibacter stalactiti]MEC5037453.1 cadmium resistance transporter [Conexibacter stalactiti]
MEDPLGVAAAAAGAFAGTNVDDLLVLALLFTTSRTVARPRPWQIWAGQYLGIGLLVGVALLAALGLTLVPDRWIGLLGLIPLALGLRGLLAAARADRDDPPPPVAAGVLAIAAVTIANGADNVAVYTPILRALTLAEVALTVAVFAALVAVWCGAGALLASHRHATTVVERWGAWLVPVVFVAIGALIVTDLFRH